MNNKLENYDPMNVTVSTHGPGRHDARARLMSHVSNADTFTRNGLPDVCSDRTKYTFVDECVERGYMEAVPTEAHASEFTLTDDGKVHIYDAVYSVADALTQAYFNEGADEDTAWQRAENEIIGTGWVDYVPDDGTKIEMEPSRVTLVIRALNESD